MPIDFHDAQNRRTYAGREADESWVAAMEEVLDPVGVDVVDVGCGGGTYAKAWREVGARSVVGVDFSEQMLSAAREEAAGLDAVRFVRGDAAVTGLPPAGADVVFSRAVIHHVEDLDAVLREARRLLRPGGTVIVQDRTPEDVGQPGGDRHPRGLILEHVPRLAEVERGRRRTSGAVVQAMEAAGFSDVRAMSSWELRAHHISREAYLADIAGRTGRSLLHELDDAELGRLVDHLREALADGPVEERDRWTTWSGSLPA